MNEKFVKELLEFVWDELDSYDYDGFYWEMTEKAIKNFFKQYQPEHNKLEESIRDAVL